MNSPEKLFFECLKHFDGLFLSLDEPKSTDFFGLGQKFSRFEPR